MWQNKKVGICCESQVLLVLWVLSDRLTVVGDKCKYFLSEDAVQGMSDAIHNWLHNILPGGEVNK